LLRELGSQKFLLFDFLVLQYQSILYELDLGANELYKDVWEINTHFVQISFCQLQKHAARKTLDGEFEVQVCVDDAKLVLRVR